MNNIDDFIKIIERRDDFSIMEISNGLTEDLKPWLEKNGIKCDVDANYIVKNPDRVSGFGPNTFHLVKIFCPSSEINGLLSDFWEGFGCGTLNK